MGGVIVRWTSDEELALRRTIQANRSHTGRINWNVILEDLKARGYPTRSVGAMQEHLRLLKVGNERVGLGEGPVIRQSPFRPRSHPFQQKRRRARKVTPGNALKQHLRSPHQDLDEEVEIVERDEKEQTDHEEEEEEEEEREERGVEIDEESHSNTPISQHSRQNVPKSRAEILLRAFQTLCNTVKELPEAC